MYVCYSAEGATIFSLYICYSAVAEDGATKKKKKKGTALWRGVEPRSPARQAGILTAILPEIIR